MAEQQVEKPQFSSKGNQNLHKRCVGIPLHDITVKELIIFFNFMWTFPIAMSVPQLILEKRKHVVLTIANC